MPNVGVRPAQTLTAYFLGPTSLIASSTRTSALRSVSSVAAGDAESRMRSRMPLASMKLLAVSNQVGEIASNVFLASRFEAFVAARVCF